MNKLKSLQVIVFSSLLFLTTEVSAGQSNGEIKVMSLNQYLGADLFPLLSAKEGEFNNALVTVLKKIAASRFIDRAQSQAAQIAKERPHVLALQEVWRLDCQDLAPPEPFRGCNDPLIAGAFNDYLENLLAALKAQGIKYKVAAQVNNIDVSAVKLPSLPAGIPFNINGSLVILNTIDRDVILVRNDVRNRPVNYKKICLDRFSLDGCNFKTLIKVAVPGGPPEGLPVKHGFVGVDASVNGKNFRIVNTHLEIHQPDPVNPVTSFYQAAQAAELIGILQTTTPADKTLLLIGDINSSLDHPEIPGPLPLPVPFDKGIVPPYMQFIEAGFTDTWLIRHEDKTGFTCCQAENLLNKRSDLYERIDFIFSREKPAMVQGIRVVGVRQPDKTGWPFNPKLWPSDHGAVSADLIYWD